MSLDDMSVVQMAEAVQRGDVTAREVVDAVLARIRATEPAIHAYVEVLDESARREADRIDRMPPEERRELKLAGVPIAVKDNMATEEGHTTAASRILAGFRAPYTATAVARLKGQGAVIIGKTNMDEFAMGSSTEHSASGPTHNPWDTARVPGGSSGGSAAAVAARSAPCALGSDTGGSIRQPAAFCGVLGLKPTYGRVSRYGLLAYASSLDQIGPLTRTVEDQALVLGIMAGRDPRDATSLHAPVPDYTAGLRAGVKGLRVGLPEEYLDGLHADVRREVLAAAARLESGGAIVSSVSLPHTRYGISAYYVIAPAEASSNLSRYDGVRFGLRETGDDMMALYTRTRAAGFGPEVKRRIMLGTYALSTGYYDAFYVKAEQVRTLIVEDFRTVFGHVDLLLTPTTPEPAFGLGEKLADPWTMYLSDVATVAVNLAGLPGLSVPLGQSQGLPIGGQLIAPWLEEGRLLRAAAYLEAHYAWTWPTVEEAGR